MEVLAAWAAALGPQTALEVDRIGRGVDVGIPGLAGDTKPGEESRMTSEGNREAGTLVDLLDQIADWVAEGNIGENTVAVEILEGLGDEVVVVVVDENAAVAVDSAGSAVEVEREVAAAPVGSELDALTKECRLDEHSVYLVWLEL